MAFLEGTRSSIEFICKSLMPDVCLSPTAPVPYDILSKFDCAVGFSPNVRFRKQFAFHNKSRLSTVRCNEAGIGGGVLSGVNLGYCRPFIATHSTTVRVNQIFVERHQATWMYMNCAGPEGPWNTIGEVVFLGNMMPANVPAGGKIAKGSVWKLPGIFGDIADLAEQAKQVYEVGKKLYALAETDWSDPSSVLGAIGGLAGIAELQKTAEALQTARGFYDLGEKVLNTDWTEPEQALSTIAGLASVANMDDFAKTAQIAGSIQKAIETDWKDPQAAIAAATGVIKNSGLDAMAMEMADRSGIDLGFIPPLMNNLPALFPIPGAASSQAAPQTSAPSSNVAKPGEPLTKAAVNDLVQASPIAYQRYQALPNTDQANAAGTLVQFNNDSFDFQPTGGSDDQPTSGSANKASSSATSKAAALYIPDANPSKLQQSLGEDWGESVSTPDKLKEVFVASQDSATKGAMFGVRQKEGEVYLFGGTITPDSKPEAGKSQPAPGSLDSWWIAESALDNHLASPPVQSPEGNTDREDFVNAFKQIASSFDKGEPQSPLRLPLDSLNEGGSSLAGTLSAAKESLIGVRDELSEFGTEVFDSVGDFYNDLFGDDAEATDVVPDSLPGINGPIPLEDTPAVPSASGQSGGGGAGGAGGAGGGASAAGSLSLPTAKPVAGAAPPSVGVDGMLVTITKGNPAAAAAAIEASFRAANASALAKALKEEEEKRKAEEAARAEEEAKRKAEEEASNDEVERLLEEFDEAEKRNKENEERASQRRREQNSFSTTMPQDFDDADEVGTDKTDYGDMPGEEAFQYREGEDPAFDRANSNYENDRYEARYKEFRDNLPAVPTVVDTAALAGRAANSSVRGLLHGQNLLRAGGTALLRGASKVNPILLGASIGASAYNGAANAPEGQEVRGAVVQVAKDNRFAASFAVAGLFIGAVPGAAIGYTVGSIADVIYSFSD
jgi:hypothetical protein